MSLLETVLSLSLFSLLSLVLFSSFRAGLDLWRSVDARSEGQTRIQRVSSRLSRDLLSSSAREVSSARLTSAGNGDAIWMLSSFDEGEADPTKVVFRRNENGRPAWRRNIIYYLVRPSNHDAAVGFSCQVDSDTEGDAICPHKILIRKVVDRPGDPEELLTPTELVTYLTAPVGVDTSVFSAEPGLVEARVLATEVLWFEAVNHARGNRYVDLDLRVANLSEAKREIALGREPIKRFLTSRRVSIFPGTEGVPQP